MLCVLLHYYDSGVRKAIEQAIHKKINKKNGTENMGRKQKRGNPDWVYGEFASCSTLIKSLLRHMDNLDGYGLVGLQKDMALIRQVRTDLTVAERYIVKRMKPEQKKLGG